MMVVDSQEMVHRRENVFGAEWQVGDFAGEVFRLISFQTRFESIARGVIDLRDVIYFGSFMALFLLLNRGPLYQAFDYVLAAARKPE